MAYTALDLTQKQIRLLHLAPAVSHDAPLECSFSLASFDDDVNYEALSYAWGDVTPIMPISLGGKEVLITKNLHSALSHLRYNDRERILWADALCINQADMVERNHQVSLMSSIYSRAALVVAYLGEAWQGCEIAMEVFEQLANDEAIHLSSSSTPGLSVGGLGGFESPELRGYFTRFFESPWWHRLWTVQEHTLARRLVFHYGTHLISGENVLKGGEYFVTHLSACCTGIYRIDGLDDLYTCIDKLSCLHMVKTMGNSRSLMYWVSTFANRESTDPRDRVYGMLGLATGVDIGIVQPDYTCSLEEVFYATTIRTIQRNDNLDIFSYLLGSTSKPWPSFVIDWMEALSRRNPWGAQHANRCPLLVCSIWKCSSQVERGANQEIGR